MGIEITASRHLDRERSGDPCPEWNTTSAGRWRARKTRSPSGTFFILPNGELYPEIASFGRAASDFYIRPFGATQVQVVFNRDYLPQDRNRIFDSLVAAHMDLIDAVRNVRKQ